MGFAVYGNHGVTHWDKDRTFDGVTLYSTLGSATTRLIDMNGNVVHEWTAPIPPSPSSASCETTATSLCAVLTTMNPTALGAKGGILVELDWDSNVVWRYDNPVIHHDHTSCATATSWSSGGSQ